MTNLVEAGLLREDEKDKLKEEDIGEMYTSRWWVPLKWSMEVLSNASHEGLVVVDGYVLLVAQIVLRESFHLRLAPHSHEERRAVVRLLKVNLERTLRVS